MGGWIYAYEPESKPAPVKPSEEVKKADPCRTGETTIKSETRPYSTQIRNLTTPMNAEQCLSLCKEQFEKSQVGGMTDLVSLKSIEVSNCTSVVRPYSDVFFRGGKSDIPSTKLSCDVEYTAVHSPYTCPRPVPGRMPNGLVRGNSPATPQASVNTLGQYLSDMATMETAAITAFYYLSKELEAYHAPQGLIDRAKQAVIEESRLAEMASLLAASYDGVAAEVTVDEFSLRPLYDIALENAVEGCINETFAAACGLWQSEQAQLDTFREVIAHITDEELGHAELSWDIHQWIMPQLSEAEQRRIQQAQVEAIENLLFEFKQESDPVLQAAFGLPSKQDAAVLFKQLKNSVWAWVSPAGSGFSG